LHWRAFPDSLLRRGLSGVKLIVSDDHADETAFSQFAEKLHNPG